MRAPSRSSGSDRVDEPTFDREASECHPPAHTILADAVGLADGRSSGHLAQQLGHHAEAAAPAEPDSEESPPTPLAPYCSVTTNLAGLDDYVAPMQRSSGSLSHTGAPRLLREMAASTAPAAGADGSTHHGHGTGQQQLLQQLGCSTVLEQTTIAGAVQPLKALHVLLDDSSPVRSAWRCSPSRQLFDSGQ